MRHTVDKAGTTRIADPNREPLRIVDQATFHRLSDSYVDITFCTATPVVSADGEFTYEAVVAAHLRLDVRLARAIVTGLSRQIAMAEAARPAAAAGPEAERLVN